MQKAGVSRLLRKAAKSKNDDSRTQINALIKFHHIFIGHTEAAV
jgi:hypothetical protein